MGEKGREGDAGERRGVRGRKRMKRQNPGQNPVFTRLEGKIYRAM